MYIQVVYIYTHTLYTHDVASSFAFFLRHFTVNPKIRRFRPRTKQRVPVLHPEHGAPTGHECSRYGKPVGSDRVWGFGGDGRGGWWALKRDTICKI